MTCIEEACADLITTRGAMLLRLLLAIGNVEIIRFVLSDQLQ